jgi:transposase
MPPAQAREPAKPAPPSDPRCVRVQRADRSQIEWISRSLDETIPDEHPARIIWSLLGRLDLSAFYANVRSLVGRAGRPAGDPKVLLALWMLATVDGIGSARRLDKLCQRHDAYRWLRGGVAVDYHTLSDFRGAHQAELDELLTSLLALLVKAGLVTLERVAQDGTKIRASAGSSSFRSEPSLEQALKAAEAQVAEVARQREQPDGQVTARQQAARERAARERQERLERAIREELPKVAALKERKKRRLGAKGAARVREPRVSATDPEARVMKQGDGGFRPSYNTQLATDAESGIVVGVSVSGAGADQGLALPVERQVEERTGLRPGAYLLDGGYLDLDDITTLESQGTRVYLPVEQRRARATSRQAEAEGAESAVVAAGEAAPASGEATAEPVASKPSATMSRQVKRAAAAPAVQAWRARMETEAAALIYRERASTSEWLNAQVKERYGLRQFLVRGTAKVTSVVLLVVLTHNLLRWHALLS